MEDILHLFCTDNGTYLYYLVTKKGFQHLFYPVSHKSLKSIHQTHYKAGISTLRILQLF